MFLSGLYAAIVVQTAAFAGPSQYTTSRPPLATGLDSHGSLQSPGQRISGGDNRSLFFLPSLLAHTEDVVATHTAPAS